MNIWKTTGGTWLIVTAFFLCAWPVCADDSGLKDAKTESRQLFIDIGNAFNKAGEKMGASVHETIDDVKSEISKQCEGTWIFKNGKAETVLVCSEGGSMRLTQKSGMRSRSWKGTYEAVAGRMTFKLAEGKHSEWKMSFSIKKNSRMQITSDDIPDDYNGFDFSNTAVFIKE
jgi:hypothetical protein